MKRLIVFGCSYAYGFGLHDCNTAIDSLTPSNYCWPVFIASAMNRKLINKSVPASSNKRIWNAIRNFKFRPDDVVIISWTYNHRSCILKSPWKVHNLINSHTDEIESSAFYKHIYSKYDSLVMSKLFVDDANKILVEKNLKVYNLFLSIESSIFLQGNHTVVPLDIETYLEDYPKADDNMHLGLEANRAFANDFMKYVDRGLDQTNNNTFTKKLKAILCKLI